MEVWGGHAHFPSMWSRLFSLLGKVSDTGAVSSVLVALMHRTAAAVEEGLGMLVRKRSGWVGSG